MKECVYEGSIIEEEGRKGIVRDRRSLIAAAENKTTLESYAFAFDGEGNLIVPFCGLRGIIPFAECAYAFDGKELREVAAISRVGKPVCFTITRFFRDKDGSEAALLSRRDAQKRYYDEAISRLIPGDIIPCRITHIERFGCFADIGRGIAALMPIDLISVSRISHPSERLSVGDTVRCVIKTVDGDGRIVLSLKEMLGTFLQNAELFQAGETVTGAVRSVESYGAFIELAPNLSGLAEPCEGISEGDSVNVYIKSIIPNKLKVKLTVVGLSDEIYKRKPLRFFGDEEHIDRFVYSPPNCERTVETVFCANSYI